MSEAFEGAYDRLRRIARGQLRRLRPGQTITTRVLVHEAFVKLARDPIASEDRNHFCSLAARVMRQVLVDHARRRRAAKRGGGDAAVSLSDADGAIDVQSDELLALDEALNRLAGESDRLRQVVELRFFGGLTEEEIATTMGVTTRTIQRDWVKARAWLHKELASGRGP